MKARLIVSSESPLNFRVSRSTASFETLKYIPGVALLGAFAAAHRKIHDDPTEFTRFFLSGDIYFGNLYPANFQQREFADTALKGNSFPIKPIPNTARSCKRFSGFNFKAAEGDEERHGVMDSLIDWGLFALSNQAKIEILDSRRTCTYTDKHGKCEELLDAFSSFYRRGEDATQIGQSKVKTRLLTRTGISRETGTVQEGILYNREVMNEGQSFWGTMSFADKSLYDDFYDFAEEIGDKGILRVGNNLTRGLGKLGVPQIEDLNPEDVASFKKRVDGFNEKFRTDAKTYGVDLSHQFYFPITLQSDAILLDSQMRYQMVLDGDYLHCIWDLKDIELVYQNAGQRCVIGWNSLWGLPKAAEWAISMGSVFLFRYSGTIDDHFYQKLYDIEQIGIGERRTEGFGQVTVADAFHWEVNEYESTDENP